jgi:hypothetical protein
MRFGDVRGVLAAMRAAWLHGWRWETERARAGAALVPPGVAQRFDDAFLDWCERRPWRARLASRLGLVSSSCDVIPLDEWRRAR